MWFCAWLLLLATRDAEMAAKLVPGLTECKPLQPEVTAGEFPKLDQALGIPFEPFFKRARVYAGGKGSGETKESFRIVFVPALGGDLGIAVNAENRLHALAWFAEAGEPKPDATWKNFLGQFRDKDIARYDSSLELPIAEFRKKMEWARRGEPSKDESERRVQALLWQKMTMEDIERTYLFLSDRIETAEKNPRVGWEDLASSFKALDGIAPALSTVLEEKAIARYRKNAEESRAVLAQALAAYQRDNRSTAKRMLDEDFQDTCSKCHGWDGHSLRKPLQKAMRSMREELGIGDGYFEPGFDYSLGAVMNPESRKAKDFQEMATALRGALLVLKRSRP